MRQPCRDERMEREQLPQQRKLVGTSDLTVAHLPHIHMYGQHQAAWKKLKIFHVLLDLLLRGESNEKTGPGL